MHKSHEDARRRHSSALEYPLISSAHLKHDSRKPLLRSLGLDRFTSFPSLSEETNSTSTSSWLKIECLQCRHRQNHLSITFILYTHPLNPIRPEKQGQIYIDVSPT